MSGKVTNSRLFAFLIYFDIFIILCFPSSSFHTLSIGKKHPILNGKDVRDYSELGKSAFRVSIGLVLKLVLGFTAFAIILHLGVARRKSREASLCIF